MDTLAARIEDLLPQTQCTRCGYPDCAGYASAIAAGDADINQCPPGGAEGIERLAVLTGRPGKPLDPAFGTEGPRAMAVIDENWCIGCTLCLDACPTDAIAGVNKRMHTVIEAHCTGCELCIPVCPVDCILLEPVDTDRTGWQAWSGTQAAGARQRHGVHKARLEGRPHAKAKAATAAVAPTPSDDAAARKRAVIEAALAKARERTHGPATAPKP